MARLISTMPIGMLMKNTQRQPGPSVSRPLAITPTDPAPPPMAPRMPRARLRSWPSAKVTATIDSAAGVIRAAPNPWNPRAAMSTAEDWAMPATSDAVEKMVSPVRSIRRLPSRSDILPPSRRNPPSTRP